MVDLRASILRAGFERYNGTLANGTYSNNKLNLEKIEHMPSLRQRVSTRLASILLPYQLGLVVPVANGANWLGEDVARLLGVPVITLEKDAETKEMAYKEGGEAVVAGVRRIGVVDDVFNMLTNTGRVLVLPGMAERTKVLGAIWDRFPGRPVLPAYPLHAVISKGIPQNLQPDSPLWEYAS